MWPSATVPHVDLWENKTHSSVADFRSLARPGRNAKKKRNIQLTAFLEGTQE